MSSLNMSVDFRSGDLYLKYVHMINSEVMLKANNIT